MICWHFVCLFSTLYLLCWYYYNNRGGGGGGSKKVPDHPDNIFILTKSQVSSQSLIHSFIFIFCWCSWILFMLEASVLGCQACTNSLSLARKYLHWYHFNNKNVIFDTNQHRNFLYVWHVSENILLLCGSFATKDSENIL
jgi:hypothetical protein